MLAQAFPGTLDYWLSCTDDRMIATAIDVLDRDTEESDDEWQPS